MTIDYSIFANLPPESPSTEVTSQASSDFNGLKRSNSRPESSQKSSPMAFVILGLAAVAVAASVGTAVPGFQQQARVEAIRAARLQNDGLQAMNSREAESHLRNASPIHTADGQLALITWEQIIRDNSIPPGAYFGQNLVVVKGLNGSGDGSQTDVLVSSHKVGNIAPEAAIKRFREIQAALLAPAPLAY